jgi:formate/nitrite transporter
MELAAAHALAAVVESDHLEADYVIPGVFDRRVAPAVADAVARTAEARGVARKTVIELSADGGPSGDDRRSWKADRMEDSAASSGAPIPGGFTASSLDALPPPEMARRGEQVGIAKAALRTDTLLALGVLAGAFIAMGAIFATTVTAGGADLPYGISRLLAGLTFSLGLILVVVAGAELFTGNNLVVMAWASRRITSRRLLWTWLLVYVGNFGGAIATAGIMYLSRQYRFGGGVVGDQVLTIAAAKTDLGFVQAVALGAFCNALVCLAVWLTYSARTTTDKILAIVPPIAAFVAAGFEHCVANMYFIPIGLFVKQDSAWLEGREKLPDLSNLTWPDFLVGNLVPVTIGNLIGGTLMVAGVYWFVYLRPAREG